MHVSRSAFVPTNKGPLKYVKYTANDLRILAKPHLLLHVWWPRGAFPIYRSDAHETKCTIDTGTRTRKQTRTRAYLTAHEQRRGCPDCDMIGHVVMGISRVL